MLNLSLKAEKQLQNENHTEDWALGSHARDKVHLHSLQMVKLVVHCLWCQVQGRFSQFCPYFLASNVGIRKVLNLSLKAEKSSKRKPYRGLSTNRVKFNYTPCRWSFKLVVHCLWCQVQGRFSQFCHIFWPGLSQNLCFHKF